MILAAHKTVPVMKKAEDKKPEIPEYLFPTSQEAFLTRDGNSPVLGVKHIYWRMEKPDHAANESDPERDKHRCWFCGFASTKFQEIHHLDGNHKNNDPSNLATICNIDHLCFHMGMGAFHGKFFLAYLPEMTQAEVTNLMRLYHTIMLIADDTTKGQLQGLHALFESRSSEVFKKIFSADFSNGDDIVQAIASLNIEDFSKRAEKLDGLRLVPNESAFEPEQLAGYLERTNREYFDMKNWPDLLQKLTKTSN